MNQIITSTTNTNRLHDYLIANVQGFHRVEPGAFGLDTAKPDCGYVTGSAEEITISFSDELPAALIQAAIDEFHSR